MVKIHPNLNRELSFFTIIYPLSAQAQWGTVPSCQNLEVY
jgi:hypothetical protein